MDFSSSLNPLGPPEGLREELQKHLEEAFRYPAPQAGSLRAALAEKLGVPESRLLMGNGASDLIHLFFLWLRPRVVLIPSPAFSEYERAALLAGAEVIRHFLPLDASLDVASLLKHMKDAAPGLLVLCNPNNPTGFFYPRELLDFVVREAGQRGTAVLLDESFFPFTGRPFQESFSCREYAHLWTVFSLTKLWAVPGLRLGCLLGPREKTGFLHSYGDPWRVNALAQRAGLFCLPKASYERETVNLVTRERVFLKRQLELIQGLEVYPGSANFLLVRSRKEGFSSTHLYRSLAAQGILIRDASNFAGLDTSFFRVAVRRREENMLLLEKLQGYFRKLEEEGF